MQEGAGLGLKIKGLGSKGRSADRGDSCARREALGPGLAFLRKEREVWTSFVFRSGPLAGGLGCPLVTCSSIFYTQFGTFSQQEEL